MIRGTRAVSVLCLSLGGSMALGGEITLVTPASGDAQYSWNSRYGPYGYEVGGTAIGVGLQMGGQYGNDYTIGIIEVPIAPLAGHELTSAVLYLTSLGFGTGYWYGSANLGWQNHNGASGDVVADGRGALGMGETIAQVWNSDWGHDASGLRSFDVLAQVRADVAAGRAYSTFVVSGSRDTSGAIVTFEGGSGPYLVVTGEGLVPEPSGLAWLGLAGLAICGRRPRG